MWRGAVVFLLLTVSINRVSAKFFSEGGSYHIPEDDPSLQQGRFGGKSVAQYYDPQELSRDQLSPYQNIDDDKLAGIVDELQRMQGADGGQGADDFPAEAYPENPYYNINANNPSANKFDTDAVENLQQEEKANKETPEQVIESKQPLTAEKKGQAEFIGFVEPINANQLKHVELMDKRVPVESRSRNTQSVRMLQSSSNVVFIALITMCCIVVVVGVVGGAYYYNNVRKSSDNTFDDFTRYSPAGPGRDKKLKKSSRGSGGNITENGDESLAYKAQLHHYQQTKQKIIGAEGIKGMAGIPGVGDMEDDKSDDELEEHNFSVYECPGLAPTGDIEVQNPNFDIKHHNVTP